MPATPFDEHLDRRLLVIRAPSRQPRATFANQISAFRAYDRQFGTFVVPTPLQQRYMVFDAIISGARGISFFGGDNPRCWNATDRRYGWNWWFWNRALDPLIEQIAARSRSLQGHGRR